jgi:para-aminobenzoate synthetase component I
VKRTTATFLVKDINEFKQRMLNWANRFNIFLFLDSHSYKDKYSDEEWVLAANAINKFEATDNLFADLKKFLANNKDWLFGHLNYDLKNYIEPLSSNHPDGIGFPGIFLFTPDVMIRKKADDEVEISSYTILPEKILYEIQNINAAAKSSNPVNIQPRISKEQYLQTIQNLRRHILKGDCYEINFCQEFFSENALINPLQLYQKLSSFSPTPFGGFYKLDGKYLLCASPERFLKKYGSKIISQPIKGTIKRNTDDAVVDEQLKLQLSASQKDKSENVMIVDLMRNDLSKFCKAGSVHVEELFGIYSFPQVHQMISTIVGEINAEVGFAEIIGSTFPMGSMTGAPKRRVMELIEQYEKTKRGIYAGSIGYITPDGDFDFNVVIRSIMYNELNKYLSYQVGGGITFYSDPEKEYEECLLKAAAIKKVLN